MAPYSSRTLKAIITVAFIISLTFLPLKSDSAVESLKVGQRFVGSKPPDCANKCSRCRPCKATLVSVPANHQLMKGLNKASSSHGEDDSYYLLSWRCRCGNKFFQP